MEMIKSSQKEEHKEVEKEEEDREFGQKGVED